MYNKFVADRITQLRLKKDISERELSLSLNKASNYINNIISGKSLPLMENFFEICDFFEITPFEFFYPNMNNPITSKKIYDELIRLSNNNLDKFLFILETMKPEEFNTFINFIDRITIKR